jgi:hypothetical protein
MGGYQSAFVLSRSKTGSGRKAAGQWLFNHD